MIHSIPVVQAKEMARLETLAIAHGCDEGVFMERAGKSIAAKTLQFMEAKQLSRVVFLVVGKGNNGGDAFTAGVHLLKRGVTVRALTVYPKNICSSLCQKQWDCFLQAGGIVEEISSKKSSPLQSEGVILDGLVGTGFRGEAEGELADAIEWVNSSKNPVIAIDIPSGVPGDTGRVGSVAIQATATIYLEFPKIGFFLEQGWDHVGLLIKGEFGLPDVYKKQAQVEAFLVEEEGLASLLKKPRRSQHKYEAGYVLSVAGSSAMVGAGILSSYAAIKSGAGIVRWFHAKGIEPLLVSTPPEVIKEPMGSDFLSVFSQEEKRAGSCIIGPGLGRDFKTGKKLASLCKYLQSSSLPTVMDADALFFLSQDPSMSLPSKALLTPHVGEMRRLVGDEAEFFPACQKFVLDKNVVLLVKGAPSFLFSSGGKPYILPFGNPGMATAGSGDVLTGILAARLAQDMPILEAAILGCYIHGLSGDFAKQDKTEFSLVASDIIEYLPKAFRYLLKQT